MKNKLLNNIYITIENSTRGQEQENINAMYQEQLKEFDKLNLYLFDNKTTIEFNLIERNVSLNMLDENFIFSLNSLSSDFKAKIRSFLNNLTDVKEIIKTFVSNNDSVFYSHIYGITKKYNKTKGYNLIYDYVYNYCKNNNIEVHS